MQVALAALLVGWYADTLRRKERWEEQLVPVRAAIKEAKFEEEVCLAAAAKARAELLSGAARPTPAMSHDAVYALAMVKAAIATTKGNGNVSGMPSVLFLRHYSGRMPAHNTGRIVVPTSTAGERRRKAELSAVKAALGVKEPWSITSAQFQKGFQKVRAAILPELHACLVESLRLLQIVERHQARAPGPDAFKAQAKNVTAQTNIALFFLGRLKLWMKGGFFGLSDCTPSGGWAGSWSEDSIINKKMMPWVGESASLTDGPAELGCVSTCLPPPQSCVAP